MNDKGKRSKKVALLSDMPSEYQLHLKDRALAETAEGITISDFLQKDNPIVYANEGFERLTGYARSDVLGKNCRFLQGTDTDPATIEVIRKSIKEKVSCSVEILNYQEDGSPFWNLLSITPIRDESGNVTNFLGIQSDITRRKNYENDLYRLSAKLERSNQRMKKDLEDARELQLLMLPTKLPELSYLDIAVSMKTADEVGGDYYDFYQEDNKLTFAFGDATGHGLKAGTIVTATKVLFNSFAIRKNPIDILSNVSGSLKAMGFQNMYMAMSMAKISKDKMTISSAGMPFPFLYRYKDKSVTEIPLKGMPLGSFANFPYKSKTLKLGQGDTLLFHSDGLSECFNKRGEVFGEYRISSLFEKAVSQSPDQIISILNEAAVQWMGKSQLRDDMTFVVIKVK